MIDFIPVSPGSLENCVMATEFPRKYRHSNYTMYTRDSFNPIYGGTMAIFFHYRYLLISVHLHFFSTNVVLGGDFSVYRSLTESEKLSLEGKFSTDCHVNVSLLSVRANKCTA